MISFKYIYTVGLLSLSLCFIQAKDPSVSLGNQVHEITAEDTLISVLNSKSPAVIMGYMHHCTWCNTTKPYFLNLATQYNSKIKFYLINGPQLNFGKHVNNFTTHKQHINKHILQRLISHRLLGVNEGIQIPGYPIFIFIKHGEIVNIQVGGCSEDVLENLIKECLRK